MPTTKDEWRNALVPSGEFLMRKRLPILLALAAFIVLRKSGVFFALFKHIFPRMNEERTSVIESPRKTLLPYLKQDEVKGMAYPPDIMPGARDVPTPFGTMRVNEWGSTRPAARKVVFVHGNATPSPIWGKIAQGLVERGCRVMTFDLWGRGYTDTPLDCKHNRGHFAAQILFAVSSSPIPWASGFSIISFSLGCAISLDFARFFPYWVNSVVLLGPAGLIRTLPPGYPSFYIKYSSLFPASFMRKVVGEILEVDMHNPNILTTSTQINKSSEGPAPTVDESTWKPSEIDVASLVQWQFDYHRGHVRSFYETARNCTAQGQQYIFKRAFDIIAGEDDDVVKPDETKEDILKLIDEEKVEFVNLPGGHGFVYPNSQAIVSRVANFWDLP